jgi:hypothetical protein
VPGAQLVQAAEPKVDATLPGAHIAQLLAMLEGCAEPGMQSRHTLLVVLGWKVPGVHDVQLAAAGPEKVPDPQLVHSGDAAAEKVPAVQSRQAVLAVFGWKVPAAQVAHEVPPLTAE